MFGIQWGVDGIGKGLAAVAGLIKAPIDGWQQRKTLKLNTTLKVQEIQAQTMLNQSEAQIEMARQGQVIVADWDARAQEQAKTSWKDEALLVVFFFPVVALFVAAFLETPGLQARIIAAVNALDKFPLWYVLMLCGITAAVYGLRWLVQPMVNQLGKFFKGG